MRSESTEEREEKILKYINQMAEQNGYPPTVREICREFGYSSTSTVHAYIVRLKEKGLISSIPVYPRTIKVETTRYSKKFEKAVYDSDTFPVTFNLNKNSINTLDQYCKAHNIDADEAINRALQLLSYEK